MCFCSQSINTETVMYKLIMLLLGLGILTLMMVYIVWVLTNWFDSFYIEHVMLKSSRTVAVGTQTQQGIFPRFSNEWWERSTGSVVSSWTGLSQCSVYEEPSMEIWQGDMCFIFLRYFVLRKNEKIVWVCIAEAAQLLFAPLLTTVSMPAAAAVLVKCLSLFSLILFCYY